MAAEDAGPRVMQQLGEAAGLSLPPVELDAVSRLYAAFAAQRARLAGAARPATEPLTIPAFDRAMREREAADESVVE